MRRSRRLEDTVVLAAIKREARRKSSSRFKAFDMIAATHPASLHAMLDGPGDRPPQTESLGAILEQNRTLREKIEACWKQIGELASVIATLKIELRRRDEGLLQLKKEAMQSQADAGELDRQRRAAEKSAARLAAAEAESAKLRGELSAKDGLLQQLRAEAGKASPVLGENRASKGKLEAARKRVGQLESDVATLKVELKRRDEGLLRFKKEAAQSKADAGELDRRRKADEKAAARLAAAEAESAKLKNELPSGGKTVKQLRAQAERASSAMRENRGLRVDLKAARERIAELESSLGRLKARRDGLSAGLERQRRAADRTAGRLAAVEAESFKLTAQLSLTSRALKQLRAQTERASSATRENRGLKDDLKAARERAAELALSLAGLKAERDKLSSQLDRLRAVAEGTATRLGAMKTESSELKAKVSARDQTIKRQEIKERKQADSASGNARLGEKLADAERRREDAEARARAACERRDELSAELASRDRAMEELRAQAERASSLADEKDALEGRLAVARERLAGAESSLGVLKRERGEHSSELDRLRGVAQVTAARLADAEGRADDAEGQLATMRAGRDYLADDLATELLKSDRNAKESPAPASAPEEAEETKRPGAAKTRRITRPGE